MHLGTPAGVSLGGMHTWLAAALDERITVCAPMIGVQGFGWAVQHAQWQGRVDSIPKVRVHSHTHSFSAPSQPSLAESLLFVAEFALPS